MAVGLQTDMLVYCKKRVLGKHKLILNPFLGLLLNWVSFILPKENLWQISIVNIVVRRYTKDYKNVLLVLHSIK